MCLSCRSAPCARTSDIARPINCKSIAHRVRSYIAVGWFR